MARKTLEALMVLALASGVAAQENPRDTGPRSLVIQYRCLPGQRALLRQRMEEAGVKNFMQWKANGLLADFHILFSRYADTNTWDMLALLSFPQYSDVARWKKVEVKTPAGLPADISALMVSVETYPADVMRAGASPEIPSRPVFFVIPYAYSVTTPDYLRYVEDYVRPQFQGWIQEGVLVGYQILLQRYTAGRPWDALIVLEYKDDDSFGQRERVLAKVRARLEDNPTWKAASENKQNLRVEKEAVIADQLSPFR